MAAVALRPTLCFPTTVVYDGLWKFAAERQKATVGRMSGRPQPWTTDPVLSKYRFTSAYRFADRTSQYLIHRVIYSGEWQPEDTLYRILLFKIFNKIETWESLEGEFGSISCRSGNSRKYGDFLSQRMLAGDRIFSSAYIMPSGSGNFKHSSKHRSFLALLDFMVEQKLSQSISKARTLKEIFELFRSFPMLGSFLAYQFAIDVNYSELTDFSEDDFVVAGPGARSGLVKCFGTDSGDSDLIKWTAERQEHEFARLGLDFTRLFGRRLMLIDVQNLFCEIDKYARVTYPEFVGVGNRTRVKRTYSASPEPYICQPVPKWRIQIA